MTADQAPGRPFDGWAQLRWSVAELQALASRLTVHLDADSESEAITWDRQAWAAAALLERALADVGTLSAAYLRCAIIDRRGVDPLGP